MNAPIRVFQVATGNVGSEMIRRIATQPDLELIGVHCYSPEKIGKDAGELAGVAPNGVKATGSIEEIIAAKPDVLTFHGVFPDEDLYVKVLEAGINIVTTADWITGWHRDKNHPHPSGVPVTQLLQEACEKGSATFYGTGMNPGLNQILGVVCSADVAEIENVTTMRYLHIPILHPGDVQSIYFLDRESDAVWRFYSIARAGRNASRLIAGNPSSAVNRAAAFYRHFVGIPTDQEPPEAW